MNAPARICNVPGCGNDVVNGNGKCTGCRRKAKKQANKRTGRVGGTTWKKIRTRVLHEEPFCRDGRVCGMRGTSVEVDHVVPLAEGGHPTARHNLQGICSACHLEKTKQEQREQNGWKEAR